jgi:cytochrome c biogenesis protein CcmG/thiol:disulfide interchange protein DsbE
MDWRYANDLFWIIRNSEKMSRLILLIPLLAVLIISIFLFIFLLQEKDPLKPPSALINEELPKFTIKNLFDEKNNITEINIANQMVIINFFASWCAPCKAEHPLFFKIKEDNPNVLILGIDMQDTNEDAIKFLNADGNPYDHVGVDEQGYVGIEFGVVGLPETFLVNKSGKIIYKYLGPLTKEIIKNEIQPLL